MDNQINDAKIIVEKIRLVSSALMACIDRGRPSIWEAGCVDYGNMLLCLFPLNVFYYFHYIGITE